MNEHHPELSSECMTEAAESLRRLLPEHFTPHLGIISGSGLSSLHLAVHEPRVEIPYSEIEGFPVSTVHGHAGSLIFGYIGSFNTPVALMNGRAHYYEGNTLQSSTFPIRVLSLLGMKICIITNAAGGLERTYNVGDVVLINDHINFPGPSGLNPLRGPNLDSFGPRFIALSDAYDLELRHIAHLAWKDLWNKEPGMKMHEGVYAFVGGPNYETRAESRMLLNLGADLVGMSTVPEVIVARHCGARVLALSVVTNSAVIDLTPRGDDPRLAEPGLGGLSDLLDKGKATHRDVVEAGLNSADVIRVRAPRH